MAPGGKPFGAIALGRRRDRSRLPRLQNRVNLSDLVGPVEGFAQLGAKR